MVTSFVLVVERAKLVTPDRIQIMEIDLSNVKITRDETALINVSTPPVPPKSEPKKTEPVGDEKTIEKPTMVTENTKPDDKPKSVNVVRVNREVMTLDRTMTISVVDALRVALTRCWVIDTARAGLDDIRAVVHLKMHNNGMVRDYWFEGAARAETDPTFAYVVETIRTAMAACQPFKMLPREMFEEWADIVLTFYPTTGKIM